MTITELGRLTQLGSVAGELVAAGVGVLLRRLLRVPRGRSLDGWMARV
jgi:hypothetical protein